MILFLGVFAPACLTGTITAGRSLRLTSSFAHFFISLSESAHQYPMQNNVLLRDVIRDDLPVFFEQQLDPEATQMAAFPARDKDSFMAHWTKILADKTVIAMTILFNGQVAGNIVCWEQEGQRLVGYWIGKNYWGKGIATKALSEFLVLVRTRPLHAHVAKHNVGSIRVLEKCGFTLSGEGNVPAGETGQDVGELVMELSR